MDKFLQLWAWNGRGLRTEWIVAHTAMFLMDVFSIGLLMLTLQSL